VAGVANLEIWQREPVRDRIAALSQWQKQHLAAFRDDRRFSNARHLGTMAALDLNVRDAGYLADIGPMLYDFFIERSVLLRPLGNTIYVMPPYCTTDAELDLVYDAIRAAADALV
jgi:adenosylmethionine-8-amino-7-oxononanoate aminotransferase